MPVDAVIIPNIHLSVLVLQSAIASFKLAMTVANSARMRASAAEDVFSYGCPNPFFGGVDVRSGNDPDVGDLHLGSGLGLGDLRLGSGLGFGDVRPGLGDVRLGRYVDWQDQARVFFGQDFGHLFRNARIRQPLDKAVRVEL